LLIPLRSVRPLDRPFRTPIITILIILANIAAFTYQEYLNPNNIPLAYIYGAIPYELTHFKDQEPVSQLPIYLNIFISLFLHGGFLHIIGNMLYLYAFGPNVENAMGHLKFLIFYLLCGVIATLSFVAINFNSKIPLIGASGAIAGIMGAHLIAFPSARIKCLLLIFIVPLPAIIVIFPWIAIQFMNLMGEQQSNIAWIAHVGGFFAGMFLLRKFRRRWIFTEDKRMSIYR